jgi:hypothetical protein
MRPFVGRVILTFALFAPAALAAGEDHERNQKVTQNSRYYDKQHKDWHEWNDDENRSYQRYTQENHRPNRDFNRLSRKDQQNYFQWRHQHSDDHPSDHRR